MASASPSAKRPRSPRSGGEGRAAKARAAGAGFDSVFVGERVFVAAAGDLVPAAVYVADGRITAVETGAGAVAAGLAMRGTAGVEVVEVPASRLLLPGVVDSHVHCNEPGRTEWEGFETATRSAVRGGVTTICDMPLNSIPPTTDVPSLGIKRAAAAGQLWTDICFWGGFVDDNTAELRPLIDAGVRGFKCFMTHSGVDEFKHVEVAQIPGALAAMRGSGRPLLFHAEQELTPEEEAAAAAQEPGGAAAASGDPADYDTFLRSRPKLMENKAIGNVISACRASGVPCHVVHLSSAEALPGIRAAKRAGVPLTVETCYHYLHFEAESIPRGEPRYKCCPPIREAANRDLLWAALADGTIDMVVSDHSPCTPNLKATDNYLEAWGGISSLQFGLSIMNTAARERGLTWRQIVNWLCEAPARIIGFDKRKGRIAPGFDADLVVFDPDAELSITRESILFKNKISAYVGVNLRGESVATYLRGRAVYRDGAFCDEKPHGQMM